MKLHLVKISPCCRIAWLYCVQNNLKVEIIDVDMFGGEHKTPEFQKISPHGEVPVLVDGDVTVYGAVPILLYLGEKYTDFNRFGDTVKEKIKVKSTLNWATSVLHKYVGHRIVYPHFMESYQLKENATESLIEKGTYELTRELEMIENYSLAKSKYLTGNFPTIADYYVATILMQLEWISFDFSLWPKITQWLDVLKRMQEWTDIHEKHRELVQALTK